MFTEVLRDVVDGTEGGVAAVLMGYDGIAVDTYASPGAMIDVEAVGMELSVVLNQIREAATNLNAGVANEVTLHAEQLTAVVRMLTPDYFVALAVGENGNYGKGRFLLRLGAQKLLQDLS